MRTIQADIDLNDLDIEDFLGGIDTEALIEELEKRSETPMMGRYYTFAVKECIHNLRYFCCPDEIVKAIEEWNKTPVADADKLQKWTGKE